jgi:hypothetical protein
VWYPYYGTWFTAILAELALLIIHNAHHYPTSTNDLTFIAIQVLRLSMFLMLAFLYFGLRNDKKDYAGGDLERQSLLGKHLCRSASSAESVSNDNTRSTPTNASSQGSVTTQDNDATSDDVWLARERKIKEQIQKRLKQDGNWFAYVKGFSVS